LICDVSTINPQSAAQFNADAKKLGFNYLDTPMSGGVTGARNGTLTFMVGGTE
jgi:3-hydroxyisobutyrate dehydrogenase